MKVTPQSFPKCLLIEPKVFGDARGYFMETFHAERYARAGIELPFVQDNLSRSRQGILRGLHLQNPRPQGKLVSVLEGEVFDVAVDVRVGSPTFGRWVGAVLSGDNHHQLYVPPGFAHGFCVTSESAAVLLQVHRPVRAAESSWAWPATIRRWPSPGPSRRRCSATRTRRTCRSLRSTRHAPAAIRGLAK